MVSIHAPVKGATVAHGHGAGHTSVSIHAPVKGATSGERGLGSATRCFNPRAREGRDERAVVAGRRDGVSIHAPVKGATVHDRLMHMGGLFQSTRP